MSKIKSVKQEKRAKQQRIYSKVKTMRRRSAVMSESKMAKLLGVERSLIICMIVKDNITTVLKEDKANPESFKIAKVLSFSFYKGLQPLKRRSNQEIQDFFLYFGRNLVELNTTRETIAMVTKLCRYYITHRVKTYKEFMKLKNKLEKDSKKSSTFDQIYIKSLEKENAILINENEILKEILVLNGIDPMSYERFIQQKIEGSKL